MSSALVYFYVSASQLLSNLTIIVAQEQRTQVQQWECVGQYLH